VLLSSIDDLAMRTRSPTLISLTDHLNIPSEEIADLTVDENFAKNPFPATLVLVNIVPHVHVQNVTYSPRELRPVGTFDQLSHFGVRAPDDVIGKRH
jgi:hypothetical protein